MTNKLKRKRVDLVFLYEIFTLYHASANSVWIFKSSVSCKAFYCKIAEHFRHGFMVICIYNMAIQNWLFNYIEEKKFFNEIIQRLLKAYLSAYLKGVNKLFSCE